MKNKLADLSPEAISEHFRKHFGEVSLSSGRQNNYLDCLYFVSARFDLSSAGFLPTRQLEEFGKLHFRISRRLIGNHLNRKRRYQPLCYAFVDAEGSRFNNSEVFSCEMPHVHSVMLAPPNHLEAFHSIIYDPMLAAEDQHLKNVDVKSYQEELGSVENLISYCMKGYKQAPRSHHLKEDLWAVFPR